MIWRTTPAEIILRTVPETAAETILRIIPETVLRTAAGIILRTVPETATETVLRTIWRTTTEINPELPEEGALSAAGRRRFFCFANLEKQNIIQ